MFITDDYCGNCGMSEKRAKILLECGGNKEKARVLEKILSLEEYFVYISRVETKEWKKPYPGIRECSREEIKEIREKIGTEMCSYFDKFYITPAEEVGETEEVTEKHQLSGTDEDVVGNLYIKKSCWSFIIVNNTLLGKDIVIEINCFRIISKEYEKIKNDNSWAIGRLYNPNKK